MSGMAHFQALAAAVLFSTGGAGIKAAAFTGPQVASFRGGIAAIAILLWLRGRVGWSWPALGVGVVYALTTTLFVNATKLTTSANAIFLQATAPLHILLLGPLLLGEKVGRRDFVYMGFVAAGLVLCFAGQTDPSVTAPDPVTGNLLALICSFTWALTLLALRHFERDLARPNVGLGSMVCGNLIACAASLPLAWPFPAAPAAEWATLVYLGVFQIGLAYVFLTRSIRQLPAIEVSLLLLLEPVLNPIWAWAIQGERPGGWVLIGGAVIIAATAGKTLIDARMPAGATKVMPRS